MKKRLGFVSNSSSSSFVILTDGLSDNQKKELKTLVSIHNRNGEGHLFEWKNIGYHGNIDDYAGDDIREFIKANNISKDKYNENC